MEWGQENNNLDRKKIYTAVAVLVAIAVVASAVYYFAVGKKESSPEKTLPVKQLTEEEKAEIEKNLVGNAADDTLTRKEKAAIEKNFINSGNTLTEEEKREIEKNFGL